MACFFCGGGFELPTESVFALDSLPGLFAGSLWFAGFGASGFSDEKNLLNSATASSPLIPLWTS